MASSMATINRINEFKRSIANYMSNAKNQFTQKEILNWRNEWLEVNIKSLPKKEQTQSLKSSLFGFSEGYYSAITNDATVFLYFVNGRFYKTKTSSALNFPHWETLPRELWPEISKFGGIYWRETLKPFFVESQETTK